MAMISLQDELVADQPSFAAGVLSAVLRGLLATALCHPAGVSVRATINVGYGPRKRSPTTIAAGRQSNAPPDGAAVSGGRRKIRYDLDQHVGPGVLRIRRIQRVRTRAPRMIVVIRAEDR